jgi:hypothetical protein
MASELASAFQSSTREARDFRCDIAFGWSAGGKKLHITFDELHDLFFRG